MGKGGSEKKAVRNQMPMEGWEGTRMTPRTVGFALLEAPEACPICDPLQCISGDFFPLAKPESKGVRVYSIVDAGCGSCLLRLRCLRTSSNNVVQ